MPEEKQTLPYGAWPSPISVDMVIQGARGVGAVWLDGDTCYWLESRPDEGGRQVLMCLAADGTARDVTPSDFNARTMVHEYGGGAYVVDDGLVCFSNLADGRLYTHRMGEQPRAITAEGPFRYADMRLNTARGLVLCVREDHSLADQEPENTICAVDLSSGATSILVRGKDFFSHPRLDHTGERLCWLSWSHPNMPWDGSDLWAGAVARDDSMSDVRKVAGGPTESMAQPEWAPDGSLVFCSDRTGWYNLYRWRSDSPGQTAAEPLAPMAAEFAHPQWVFGASNYAIGEDGTIVAAARSAGTDTLWMLDSVGSVRQVAQPFAEISSVRMSHGRVFFRGATSTQPSAIVSLDAASGEISVLHRAAELSLDEALISKPEPISFPTAGEREAHALFYPPANPRVSAPQGELPPLVVMSHGGPTSQASPTLDLGTQFFTSRGFAVVDVDYGGSSGYGREYRQRLNGAWGIVDVQDCTNAALFLADSGRVDRRRLLIRGGSAGGYTTLRALTETDVFAAGASHYGVGDLAALAQDTHKFESRYLDGLVGPYPERSDLYRERSPVYSAERLACPLIIFQGTDDRVVPIAQAEQLVSALVSKGIPYAYLPFSGEGHGFRRAENIRRALEAELSFYAQLFGFNPSDSIEPVEIHNLLPAPALR